MSFMDYLVTGDMKYPFIDAMVLFELPDEVYRQYVDSGLFAVDHHGALRFEPTTQVIAANREQFDILIASLERMRDGMDSRGREPKPDRLRGLIPDDGYGERAWSPANDA